MAVDLTENFDTVERPGAPGSRPPPPPEPPVAGSAAGQCGVRREHQAHADLSGLQRGLGLRPALVQREELAELDLVRLLQTQLAERPLRALRRSTQDARRAAAL